MRTFKREEWPHDYYIWLCDLIDLRSHRHYEKLISFLFNTEFYWSVANDINRAEDGKELRFEFIFENGEYADDSWVDEPCSVLEMLIALARRVRNDIMPDYDIEIDDWFWQFVSNLGLDDYDDRHFYEVEVDEICENFLTRNGKNVLFFCGNRTKKEILRMEIWYQMQFWLAENYDF